MPWRSGAAPGGWEATPGEQLGAGQDNAISPDAAAFGAVLWPTVQLGTGWSLVVYFSDLFLGSV